MEMNDIFQLLINSSGAAIVAGLFVWYIKNRDISDRIQTQKIVEQFNNVVTNHIKDATKVMQEVSDANRELVESNRDLREVIQKLYAQNFKLVKRAEKAERATS